MSYSYNPLWKLLVDKGLNKSDLRELAGISKTTIARMTQGKPVNLSVLDKICNTLNCTLSDIVIQIRDGEEGCQKK